MRIIFLRYLTHKAHRTNDTRIPKNGSDPWLKPSLERPPSNPTLRTATVHESYTALIIGRRKRARRVQRICKKKILPSARADMEEEVLWQRAAGWDEMTPDCIREESHLGSVPSLLLKAHLQTVGDGGSLWRGGPKKWGLRDDNSHNNNTRR